MRSVRRRVVMTLLTITALVHGGLSGTVMALHLADHDHDALPHESSTTAIELILHGHDHAQRTPEHQHIVVTVHPVLHVSKHARVSHPADAALHVDHASAARLATAVCRVPEVGGPSPPFPNRTVVILRI